ncbi:hypothetical protein KJ599_02420, partial [bacterium]|nr:hypothetical protein [bacterium]
LFLNPRSGRGQVLIQAKLSGICYILPYLTYLVKIKASSPIYIDKSVFSFDFPINTPYFMQLKRDPHRYKKDPFLA